MLEIDNRNPQCWLPDSAEVREATFWDQEADRITDAELLREQTAFDEIGLSFLQRLGAVDGMRVLDVGCGTGFWAVKLARMGADVSAIDISPRSVQATRRRAELAGMKDRVHASVMSATDLRFADSSFDLVYGQDIIHHLDGPQFGREVARVLRPTGRAVFSENSANNGLLMFARDHLCGRWGIPKWSSDDEYPLTRKKLGSFSQFFARTSISYPKFLFFFYLDAKLFGYRNRMVSWLCRTSDKMISCLAPYLRQYSYRQIVCCEGTRSLRSTRGSLQELQ